MPGVFRNERMQYFLLPLVSHLFNKKYSMVKEDL